MSNDSSQPPPSDEPQAQFPSGPRLLESEQILEGEKSVLIRHESDVYRLTVTRNGKLILQK
ncbi:MAG: hemin uptake protein HemP [Planctomycetota bacterium]